MDKPNTESFTARKENVAINLPAPWPNVPRPLSDIRELTEPNLLESASSRRTGDAVKSIKLPLRPPRRDLSSQSALPTMRQSTINCPGIISPGSRVTAHTIPLDNIPPRSSSRSVPRRSTSVNRKPAVLLPPPQFAYRCVSNRGQARSPVKDVATHTVPEELHWARRLPSKTIVKVGGSPSDNLLDHPVHVHPRLRVDIQVAAPLFVGGSSVEGSIRIVVDQAERVRHRKTLTLERLCVDLLGIEEVSGAKRNVFLALSNELVDSSHSPPSLMVESQSTSNPVDKPWILMPSVSSLPFLITLPLEVGPPPFQSKHARIRYVICATLTIKDAGRQLCVRTSQDTSVLSVYDPEKALMSLPSPLTASDQYRSSRSKADESVIVTAGLHRQVWVSGTSIFADVHVVNSSQKLVKKLELQLERIVLCYRHAPAATLEMSASPARLFDQLERTIVSTRSIKQGTNGWPRVPPHSTNLRTCDLELPRDHATIKCHKYFEVRYYLNIVVSVTRSKLVTVQLPIILIHMNSLDVPTNSVAQVAAAIEAKRGVQHDRGRSSSRLARQTSQNIQGRAFAAPRDQSLDQARAQQQDLENLGHILDASPRKHSYPHKEPLQRASENYSFKTPPRKRSGRVIPDAEASEIRMKLGRKTSFGSVATNRSLANSTEPRSTSALGSYLQEDDLNNRRAGISTHGRKLSGQRSFDAKRPNWRNERWKPMWWDAQVGNERD